MGQSWAACLLVEGSYPPDGKKILPSGMILAGI
jgi:hypothetical protein